MLNPMKSPSSFEYMDKLVSFSNSDDEDQDDQVPNAFTFPIQFSGNNSMDNIDFAKGNYKKAGASATVPIISIVDQKMKEHTGNLLHVVDCLCGRLSQLESRTCNIEQSIDNLRNLAEDDHSRMDDKLRELDNILSEVQGGIKDLRDKQEIAEAHVQLAKLQMSNRKRKLEKEEPKKEKEKGKDQVSSQQAFPSGSYQSLPSPVASSGQISPFGPPTHANFPQDPLATAAIATAQPPNHWLTNVTSSVPQPQSYTSAQLMKLGNSNYQHDARLSQQMRPIPQSSYQYYEHSAQYSSSQQPLSDGGPLSPERPPSDWSVDPQTHYPVKPYPEEMPYMTPQSYPLGISNSFQLPDHAKRPEPVHIGFPHQMSDQTAKWSKWEPSPVHTKSLHHFDDQDLYTQASYMSPTSKAMPDRENSFSRLPTALPTASFVDNESGSSGTGDKMETDDIVDKVVAMGFRRDLVKSTMRKLKEDGRQVDLNAVLDKLMNE